MQIIRKDTASFSSALSLRVNLVAQRRESVTAELRVTDESEPVQNTRRRRARQQTNPHQKMASSRVYIS